MLGDPHLLGKDRALADQLLQVLIERIDARPDRTEVDPLDLLFGSFS